MADVMSRSLPATEAAPTPAGGPAGRQRIGNVGGVERALSLLGGGLLALLGLRRRTAGGLAAGAAGLVLIHRGATGHCAAYRALGMSTAARGTGRAEVRDRGYCAQHRLRIHRSPEELYAFWREFTTLPRVLWHIQSVTRNPDGTLHWVAREPVHAAWDARTTEDQPNRRIAWETLPESEVHHTGAVEFLPGPGGSTDVLLSVAYAPPAGILGKSLAGLLGGDPARQLADGLRRFKQVMEAGEVPTIQGQPRGG